MTENNQWQYEVVSDTAENTQPAPAPKASVAGKIMGIISMVLGITGIATCWCYGAGFIYAIAGIVMGVIAGKKGEAKFSRIGKITSVLGIIFSVLFIVGIIILAIIAALSEM